MVISGQVISQVTCETVRIEGEGVEKGHIRIEGVILDRSDRDKRGYIRKGGQLEG